MATDIKIPAQTENETDPDDFLSGLVSAVDAADFDNLTSLNEVNAKQALSTYVNNNAPDIGVITVENTVLVDGAVDAPGGDPVTAYMDISLSIPKTDPLYYKIACMELMKKIKDNSISLP